MKRLVFRLFFSFYGVCFLSSFLHAQESSSVKFCFYNVENLFDTYDDSLSADEEFLPGGDKSWSKARYYKKIDQIARTLTGIGGWELPGIVGLCEIENIDVLYDLCEHRLLKTSGYEIIHKDSPDRRGIDVAILYIPSEFEVIHSQWIGISFPFDSSILTRDILYVKGLIGHSDTLHIFINHWPSRWGGIEASMPKRLYVAQVLKCFSDSILQAGLDQHILIAGDMNDTPRDSSMVSVLGACVVAEDDPGTLYNLMTLSSLGGPGGTLKYRADWEIFDQIIVSGSLLNNTDSFFVTEADIYSAEYLLIEDEKYMGKKPFRTYLGPSYIGGFSDHLPVSTIIYYREKEKK